MPVNKHTKPFLIVITGPTAIGKSEISVQVARHFSTEIISADSRQIYREMCIGTAVPGQAELSGVPHHFIHSRSIHDYYNASRFEEDVLLTLESLFQRHRVVVMTGGSMLYIDAVCQGIDDLPGIDPELRQNLLKRYEDEGLESLRLQLKHMDPEYYAQVDLMNHKRILHALEVCLMTGKPYSSFRTGGIKERPFQIVKIGLNAKRDILYDRINERVDQMVRAGLEEEARQLFPFRHYNALNTVGYREWFDYFDDKLTRDEAIFKIKSNTRRYARKQLTWFRRDPAIRWFDIDETGQIIPYIEMQWET